MTGAGTRQACAHGPLTEALLAARASEVRSFHMPGHKGGAGASEAALALLGGAAFAADLSELGGFDYLHAASGGIARSEQMAASLFGADRTHFLVNGATVGNIAALLATTGDDGEALVLRASHRSMYAGLTMSGVVPRYVGPARSDALDGWFGADLDAARAIAATSQGRIQAIHVTRPSYYGFCIDLRPWVDLAASLSVPLLVDEAHGTHFVFHPALPASALSLGADIVVQSPHKTLASLTQSSLLHVQGSRVDRSRLLTALGMLQSSSPSALLLASLDLACAQMMSEGVQRWAAVLALSHDVRAQIDALPGLQCVGDEVIGLGGIDQVDPTKIVIDVSRAGLTGWGAAAVLRATAGVNPEFADGRRVVCSLTIGDDHTSGAVLVDALSRLGGSIPGADLSASRPPLPAFARDLSAPVMRITPRVAAQLRGEDVEMAVAAGRVAAEFVIPYPPGIPLVVPGEVLDAATLAHVRMLQSSGASIVGTADPTLSTIRVVAGSFDPIPADIEGRGYPL